MQAGDFVLDITQSVDVAAPIDRVFASVLERASTRSVRPDGTPMPMRLEAWPGGRWFRDLGDDTGHLWGHVQVIKPPGLLEIHGPLFMSFAATCHVQWRLEATDSGTRLSIRHRTLGLVPDETREGLNVGWTSFAGDVKTMSE